MSEGRILFFDCVGGVAGDMLLAALADAADCTDAIDDLPRRLGFSDVSIAWRQARPGGFAARGLDVHFDPAAHPEHRTLKDIDSILEAADIPTSARQLARRVFTLLAEAEATVHGTTSDAVHFHEVGAVDAIVDIVGCALAVDRLELNEIVCSPLPMGHGTITSAHGVLPVPAPAVAALLPGTPIRDAGVEGETVTPTGAALVKALASRFGWMPTMTVERVGVGAGTRVFPQLPNIVRAIVGRFRPESSPVVSGTTIVECNVDDTDPRLLPTVVDELMAAGAVDAYITPIIMKKGRPGHLITAILPEGETEAVVDVLLRSTTTLGCRTFAVTKHGLQRRTETVTTEWGPVPVKVALCGGEVLRAEPEFEVCAALARQAGVPIRDVLLAATSAARAAFTRADD